MKRLCVTFSLNAPTCKLFLKRFVNWWIEVADDDLMLTLKDIIPSFPKRKDILNYLLILGKLIV